MNQPIVNNVFLLFVLIYGPTNGGIIDPSCQFGAQNCVCSVERAQDELNRLFFSLQYKELESALDRFRCMENFERLPNALLIDATQTPYINPATGGFRRDEGDLYHKRKFRYLRRKKRQVFVGVPTDDTFKEAIAQINPRAFHQYAVLGSSVQFTCVGPDIDVLDDIDPRSRKFVWSHYNGAPVTSPQSIVDGVSGMLTMRSVQLSDTGVYNCSIKYAKENGQTAARTFNHQLSVVSEPIMSLEFSLRYTTNGCERLEKLLISDHLELWIRQLICPFCQVHNATVHCAHGASQAPSSSREYEITLVVSLANLNFRFDRSSAHYEHLQSCAITCSELYQVALLKIVGESLQKLFSLPIEVSMGSRNPPIVHEPIPQTVEFELLLGCLSGFHFDFKLCFPCDVGHFSPDGQSDCFPCPVGSYQPLPGSSSCIPCENNYKTLHPGSASHSDCIVSTLADLTALFMRNLYICIAVLGAILLIIIIIVAIRCCCPTSWGIGRCVNAYCCCCCPAEVSRAPAKENISMVELRSIPKTKEPSRRPEASSRSKIKYKRLPDTATAMSEESDNATRRKEAKSKSKKSDKVTRPRSAVASNILLKTTAYEDEDDEVPSTSTNINRSRSRVEMRKILSEGDDEDENRSVPGLASSSLRHVPSIHTNRGFADPLALHRCKQPLCAPKIPGALSRSTLHAAKSNLRPVPVAQNAKIPKPPPLPNYFYGK